MARCKGTTTSGKRCRRVPRDGHELCAQHAGTAKPREVRPGARPPGRVSRLEEAPDEIIAAARLAYLRSAGVDAAVAASLNLAKGTYAGWRRQGRVDIADGNVDTPFARLEQAIDDAKAELIGELSGHHIANALHQRDARELRYHLRRLDPDTFADPDRRAPSGDKGNAGGAAANAAGGPPIQVLNITFGDDVQDQITAILTDRD